MRRPAHVARDEWFRLRRADRRALLGRGTVAGRGQVQLSLGWMPGGVAVLVYVTLPPPAPSDPVMTFRRMSIRGTDITTAVRFSDEVAP